MPEKRDRVFKVEEVGEKFNELKLLVDSLLVPYGLVTTLIGPLTNVWQERR